MGAGSQPVTPEWGRRRAGPPVAVRLAAVALAVGWLAYEWHRWPNGSPLLGPLGLVWYNGPTAGNLGWCAAGLLLVLAYPARPGHLTAAVSVLGLLLWALMGVLAHGIGC